MDRFVGGLSQYVGTLNNNGIGLKSSLANFVLNFTETLQTVIAQDLAPLFYDLPNSFNAPVLSGGMYSYFLFFFYFSIVILFFFGWFYLNFLFFF